MTDIEKIAKEFNKLILEVSKLPKAPQEMKHLSAELKFFPEEIIQLPKDFRKMFRSLGCVVHVLKVFEDYDACYYELRFLRNGYNVVVLSRDLAEAKSFFIAKVIEFYG